MAKTNGATVDEVLFITAAETVPGSRVGLQQLDVTREVSHSFREVLINWQRMLEKVQKLADEAAKQRTDGNFVLSQLELSLGFTATGKLAFIAEASVEASVTLTFTPPKAGTKPGALQLSRARKAGGRSRADAR